MVFIRELRIKRSALRARTVVIILLLRILGLVLARLAYQRRLSPPGCFFPHRLALRPRSAARLVWYPHGPRVQTFGCLLHACPSKTTGIFITIVQCLFPRRQHFFDVSLDRPSPRQSALQGEQQKPTDHADHDGKGNADCRVRIRVRCKGEGHKHRREPEEENKKKYYVLDYSDA